MAPASLLIIFDSGRDPQVKASCEGKPLPAQRKEAVKAGVGGGCQTFPCCSDTSCGGGRLPSATAVTGGSGG